MALPVAPIRPLEAPSLDALAQDPTRTAALTPDVAADLVVTLAGLQERLRLRAQVRPPDATFTTADLPGQTLTATEAAARLRVPRAYVYELVRRAAGRSGWSEVPPHPRPRLRRLGAAADSNGR